MKLDHINNTIHFSRGEIADITSALTQEQRDILNKNIVGQIICPAGILIEINSQTREIIQRIESI